MGQFIALIHKDAQSEFGVSFPDLPGCVTAGATLDEARLLAAEYTDDELRAAVTAWVAAGDECFHG